MSAYVVSAETLAGATKGVIDTIDALTPASHAAIAAALYKMNKHAVSKRYNEPEANNDSLPAGYIDEWKAVQNISRETIGEFVTELWYQCSEDLDPLYQDAYAQLSKVRRNYL